MWEFLGTLFVFGSVAFWVLIVVASIAIAVFIENDEVWSGGVFFTTLLTLGALQWMSDIKVFSYAAANPFVILKWFAIYVALGIVWSVIKWIWACYKVRDHVHALRQEFNKLPPGKYSKFCQNNANREEAWLNYFGFHIRNHKARIYVGDTLPPLASENKEQLIFWTVFWPWSVIGTIVSAWLREFYEFVYRRLTRVYQAIADYIFDGLKAPTVGDLTDKNGSEDDEWDDLEMRSGKS